MKKLNILLLITTLLGSWLFYQHDMGLNLVLFSCVLISISLWLNPLLVSLKKTLLVVGCILISTSNLIWHHSTLSMTMTVISLMVLAGLALNPQSSYFIASINSGYSFLASVLIKSVEWLDNLFYAEQRGRNKPKLSKIKVLSFLFPISISILFISLYTSANPALEKVIETIDLGFINWHWIRFTLLTYIVLFGFFFQTQVQSLTIADTKAPNQLHRKRKRRFNVNFLALNYELKSGILLFLLLNLILLGFHLVDAYFLIFQEGNSGLGHSAYLHQGVNTLIVSVVLAIAIIVYYFRGNLNFYKKNSKLKFLVYAWIAQNAILITTTALKNYQYIADYGLTYKRIGVYFYLGLTLIGLVTTLIKTKYIKSNWYLLRSNSLALYLLLVFGTFFNGDQIITRYNLMYTKEVDIDYLLDLSDKNIPLLITYEGNNPGSLNFTQKRRLDEKAKAFLEKQVDQKWNAWNYVDYSNELKLIGDEK